MKKIICVFVSSSGFVHEIIGAVVRKITKSKWSHVALGIEIDGKFVLIESVAPKVKINDINFYDNEKNKEYIEIEITDDQHNLMEIEIKKILNDKYWYGLNDCIAGGVTDFFSKEMGEELVDIICENVKTMDCSELYTRIIKAAFSDFLIDFDPDAITPERAYKETKIFFKNQIKN